MGLKMFYISDDPFKKKTFPMIPRLNSRLKYKSNSILAHDSKSLGVTISPDIFPHHFFFLACFSSSLQFTRLFAYFLQISSSLQFMSPCFKNFPQFTCSLLSLDFFSHAMLHDRGGGHHQHPPANVGVLRCGGSQCWISGDRRAATPLVDAARPRGR
jgi:hypothetical protein